MPILGVADPNVAFPHLNTDQEREENYKDWLQWSRQVDLTIQDISPLIRPGDVFILVDEAKFGGEVPTGRPLPFAVYSSV